ncbi:uncharacterized protein ACNLHF_024805 [Anomaloglossus baeobatrachus]
MENEGLTKGGFSYSRLQLCRSNQWSKGDVPSGIRPREGKCLIWILGHSFVFWGARRAEVRQNGRQLGLDRAQATVRWIGDRGMEWSRVVPEFHFHCKVERPPDVLVLHVGGNDLGARASQDLIRDIKLDLLQLWKEYPGLIVMWSDIVTRLAWRGARSVDKVNKARAQVNRVVARFMTRNGGLVVRHRELEPATWQFRRGDGVHLNDIGADLWALGLQDGVERAFGVWRIQAT